MTEELFQKLSERFSLTPCPASEYETFQMSGLDFSAKGYESERIGHVSVLEASGMGGAMRMESMIINPFDVDAPLFSLDLIAVPGKYTLMMELYDTLVDLPREEGPYVAAKERYSHIPDLPQKTLWYDDIRFHASVTKEANEAQKDDLQELIRAFGSLYLDQLKHAPACDPEKKRVKADAYRDGLLAHGGPATDAFLKTWGEEKTRKLFTEVLFG